MKLGASRGQIASCSQQHKVFFREHRHYVNPETKVSCDLVLMVQDISDLHRILKVVVEVTFRTTKIKSLGLNKVYRVEMWEGHKLNPRLRVSVQNKKYSKEIFPLYSSYSGGQGKEVQVDSRQNILNNKTLWVMIGSVILLAFTSLYFVKRFFQPETHIKGQQGAAMVSGTKTSGKEQTPPAGASPAVSGDFINSSVPAFSERWRLAGRYINKNGQMLAVVSDQNGHLRVESPSVFNSTDYTALGYVDGQRVTVWTGTETKRESAKQRSIDVSDIYLSTTVLISTPARHRSIRNGANRYSSHRNFQTKYVNRPNF